MTVSARRWAATALAAALAVAALAGCGGGDAADAPTTSAVTAPDPRAGWFGPEQSDALNPAIARLNAAAVRFDAGLEPCDREARRLFEGGASARRSVRCHLRMTRSMRDASRGLARAVRGVEGDFRPACRRQLRRVAMRADRLRAVWQASLANWEGYARGDAAATARVTRDADRAMAATRAFLVGDDAPVAELGRACSTPADIAGPAASRTTTG